MSVPEDQPDRPELPDELIQKLGGVMSERVAELYRVETAFLALCMNDYFKDIYAFMPEGLATSWLSRERKWPDHNDLYSAYDRLAEDTPEAISLVQEHVRAYIEETHGIQKHDGLDLQ